MLLFAARTRYSLVKGERIVRSVRTAQLRASNRPHCLHSYARRGVSSPVARRGGTNQSLPLVSFSWAAALVLNGPCKPFNSFLPPFPSPVRRSPPHRVRPSDSMAATVSPVPPTAEPSSSGLHLPRFLLALSPYLSSALLFLPFGEIGARILATSAFGEIDVMAPRCVSCL
jgi:hypothetical protein